MLEPPYCSAQLYQSEAIRFFLPEHKEEFPFGEDVKMIRAITQRPVYLTSAERAEVAIKYKRGMSMVA